MQMRGSVHGSRVRLKARPAAQLNATRLPALALSVERRRPPRSRIGARPGQPRKGCRLSGSFRPRGCQGVCGIARLDHRACAYHLVLTNPEVGSDAAAAADALDPPTTSGTGSRGDRLATRWSRDECHCGDLPRNGDPHTCSLVPRPRFTCRTAPPLVNVPPSRAFSVPARVDLIELPPLGLLIP